MSEPVQPRVREPGSRLVLLAGLALSASIFIPWFIHPEIQVTDQPSGIPWIFWVAPWLGFPILASAFLRPRWARPILFLSGAALVTSMAGFAIDDRSLRSMSVAAAAAWSFGLLFAVGAEIAMHRAPRSRGRAICAAIGWAAVLVAYAVPMRRSGEFEDSLLGRMLERSDLVTHLFAIPLVLVVVGLVQALRRTGPDRDRAASRRFHSAWLAWMLVPIPLLAVSFFALFKQGIDGFHHGLILFGVLAGGALGVVAAIELVGACVRALTMRRALQIVGAIAAVWLAFAFAGWIASRNPKNALTTRVADEVERAMRGGRHDPQYIGGYSEFDLRGTPATLPPEAVRVVAGLRLWVSRDRGREESVWALDSLDGMHFVCELTWRDMAGSFPAPDVAREFERDWKVHPVEASTQARLRTLGILGAPRDCAESIERPRRASWTTLGDVGDEASVDRYLIAFDLDGERRWYTGRVGDLHGRMWIGAPELREGE